MGEAWVATGCGGVDDLLTAGVEMFLVNLRKRTNLRFRC